VDIVWQSALIAKVDNRVLYTFGVLELYGMKKHHKHKGMECLINVWEWEGK